MTINGNRNKIQTLNLTRQFANTFVYSDKFNIFKFKKKSFAKKNINLEAIFSLKFSY